MTQLALSILNEYAIWRRVTNWLVVAKQAVITQVVGNHNNLLNMMTLDVSVWRQAFTEWNRNQQEHGWDM